MTYAVADELKVETPAAVAAVGRVRAVYFATDLTSPSVNLRVTSLEEAGCDVAAFTFRRDRFNKDFKPGWSNTPLGTLGDGNYLRRIPAMLRACAILAKNRQTFQQARFFYARMFDAALLAVFAKWISGSKAKIVYEIEDLQAVMFKRTLMGAAVRWIERRILRRTDLLVVLSPGFVRGYYQPVQNYIGPSFVLENKIHLRAPVPAMGPASARWRDIKDRWVIGWNGTLRCERSIAILAQIAERMGDRVEIVTRGHPTETGLEAFMAVVNRHSNWRHGGEYKIPDDLEAIYGQVHFSWCFDFHDPTGNSPLLLACRLYQGGYYGAVPLVPTGSEMERFLRAHAIGHSFEEPLGEAVVAFLEQLSWTDYEAERARVLALGPSLFLDTGEDSRRLLALIGSL